MIKGSTFKICKFIKLNINDYFNMKNQINFKGDFGFARKVKEMENFKYSSAVGTPLYMAPQLLTTC